MALNISNEDCMQLMARYPDKHFELGCIDPPYGLGNRICDGGSKLADRAFATLYKGKSWDVVPPQEFWIEFFRVTQNQIVFGGNYFLDYLPSSRGFVCWDKQQSMPTLSACELVWTSYDKPSKIFKQHSRDLNRFHPCQKPQKLYEFMFDYVKAKQGDKILDCFLGSGSIALACHDYGFDLTACELDTDYYNAAMKRIAIHTAQLKLF
jgi:site-specific DNA-methyltransferase (adenine-specific)